MSVLDQKILDLSLWYKCDIYQIIINPHPSIIFFLVIRIIPHIKYIKFDNNVNTLDSIIIILDNIMENIDINNLNYISKKLVDSADNIWVNLDKKYQQHLKNIVDDIINILDKKLYFNNVKELTPQYTLIDDTDCEIDEMGIIDNSKSIIKQFNKCKKYELDKAVVTIYHNNDDNADILKKNIDKIMTRLHNLFILYKDKHIDDFSFNLLEYDYIFYLYNNPRRVNRNMSGKEYLQSINNSHTKCFNTASGVTELRKKIIRTSRIEDCLGLLTHEVLHGCGLININDSNLIIHGIKVNFTEAFVNMFASIVNVYLTCIEHNMMEQIPKYLLIELIHSINHTVKYCIIQGISITSLFQKNQHLHQDVYMYEYIVVKMLLFINFKDILSNKDFKNQFLSLSKPWSLSKPMTKYIQDKFLKYNILSDTIKLIDKIHRKYLAELKESNKLDGNMIMSYHAIDTMMIESSKEIKQLYGGSTQLLDKRNINLLYMTQNASLLDAEAKYLKYKTKYLLLKKQKGGSWFQKLPFMSQQSQPVYKCPSNQLQEIIVRERCCNRPTQFPVRMIGCENTKNTAAGYGSYALSYIKEQNKSIDGIVEVRNSTTEHLEPISSTIEHISKEHISDHDGIVLNLSYTTTTFINFNIISCNLEGLCRSKDDSKLYADRIRMLNTYFDIIKPGTIMVCQEIVLKKLAENPVAVTKATKQIRDGKEEWSMAEIEMINAINISGNEILAKLKENNSNLDFISDGYTSGIFYDIVVWELVDSISISRLYNGKLDAKYSNAYLFKCREKPTCIFWIVNIHLKALQMSSSSMLDYGQQYISAFSGSETYVNETHIIELEHIISELIIKTGQFHFTTPVYLCGDYNNDSQKHILIKKALERYYSKNPSNVTYRINERPML